LFGAVDSLLVLAFYLKKIQLLKNKNNVLLLVGYKKRDLFYRKSYRRDGRGTKQKTEDFLFQKNWVLFCVALGSDLIK